MWSAFILLTSVAQKQSNYALLTTYKDRSDDTKFSLLADTPKWCYGSGFAILILIHFLYYNLSIVSNTVILESNASLVA